MRVPGKTPGLGWAARAMLAAAAPIGVRPAAACGSAGSALAVALHAAIPAGPCAVPWRLLRYPGYQLLLTLDRAPGAACEGCAATIRATRLSLGPAPHRLDAAFTLATLGQQGDPGRAAAVRLGQDDGVAIETPYLAQGYASTMLTLVALHAGRAVPVAPGPLILSADSTASTDAHPARVVGHWSITPAPPELHITYATTQGGHAGTARAVWALEGARLRLIAGAVPAAAVAASGN